MRLVEKLHYSGPIRLDANAVYFIEYGGAGANGRLLKIAKP